MRRAQRRHPAQLVKTYPGQGVSRGNECGGYPSPREKTSAALRKTNAAAIVGTLVQPDNWWRCGRARETVAADGTDGQTRRPHHHWLSELSPRGRRTDALNLAAALPGSFAAEPAFALSDCAVAPVGFAACVPGARAPGDRLHRPETLSPGGISGVERDPDRHGVRISPPDFCLGVRRPGRGGLRGARAACTAGRKAASPAPFGSKHSGSDR
jgi:hypothetical protein